MADALQLDRLPAPSGFCKIKKAFTPQAVRKIHEAIVRLWPSPRSCSDCLAKERHRVTALYSGTYEPESVFNALRQHALYSDKILLADPFVHPLVVRDPYNPILHPEQNRSNTAKWSYLWLTLAPWIVADAVNFIQPPSNCDPKEFREIADVEKERIADSGLSKDLMLATEERAAQFGPLDSGVGEFLILGHSDAQLRGMYRSAPTELHEISEDEFIQWVHDRQAKHPYFLSPFNQIGPHGEFLHETCGTNYESSKRVCSITNSHIITNLSLRWKQLEADHEHSTGNIAAWSPFAKALQNADLKILKTVPLEAAFRLREENRLESFRHFFNRVWRSCREPNAYAEQNAANLAAELDHEINEARKEWDEIDKDLVKWFGAVGGSIFTGGLVGFLPAAPALLGAALTGAAAVGLSSWQRASFERNFPAGFFLRPFD